jgi:hypothetical protein
MKRKYFFDHMPKTGGISIYQTICGLIGRQSVSPNLNMLHKEAIARYSDCDLISSHTGYMPGEQLDESRYYFTMLRSPIDRILSQYWYWKNDVKDSNRSLVLFAKKLPFDEYVLSEAPEVVDSISNVQTKHFVQLVWDGSEIMTDDRLLELAKSALDRFDLVGVYHRFMNFMDVLCYECGWPFIENMPSHNITSRRESIASLGAATKKRLLKLNELDVEFYEFAANRFEKKMREVMRLSIGVRNSEFSLSMPSVAGTDRSVRTKPDDTQVSHESDKKLPNFIEFGSRKIEITGVLVEGEISLGTSLYCGENTCVTVSFAAYSNEKNVAVGIQIFDEAGAVLYGVHTRCFGKEIEVLAGNKYFIKFRFCNNFAPGNYTVGAYINIGLSYSGNYCHWKDSAGCFESRSYIGFHFAGKYNLNASIEICAVNSSLMPTISNAAENLMSVQQLAIHTPILTEFAGKIQPLGHIAELKINEVVAIEVSVTNVSSEKWPVTGQRPVCLSYHWRHESGDIIVHDGLRTAIPRSLNPGESVRMFMMLKAPGMECNAILHLTLLQEHVAWFDAAGCPSHDLQIDIRIN